MIMVRINPLTFCLYFNSCFLIYISTSIRGFIHMVLMLLTCVVVDKCSSQSYDIKMIFWLSWYFHEPLRVSRWWKLLSTKSTDTRTDYQVNVMPGHFDIIPGCFVNKQHTPSTTPPPPPPAVLCVPQLSSINNNNCVEICVSKHFSCPWICLQHVLYDFLISLNWQALIKSSSY